MIRCFKGSRQRDLLDAPLRVCDLSAYGRYLVVSARSPFNLSLSDDKKANLGYSLFIVIMLLSTTTLLDVWKLGGLKRV